MVTRGKTKNKIFIPTELKLNIHIEPIGDVTMDDYDFDVEVYCSPVRAIKVNKSEALRIDSDNYVVLVDTKVVGAGDLKCKVIAYIPDGDFPDSLRTEVVCIDTEIDVEKGI
jgi:hypothetical protein